MNESTASSAAAADTVTATVPPPVMSPQDEIRFIEHHRAQLEAGDYTFCISQKLWRAGHSLPQAAGTTSAGSKQPAPAPDVLLDRFEATRSIAIVGERFSMAPELIAQVFPPRGSRGDYWHLFPHLVLTRSTLPWERAACSSGDKNHRPPWLALLVFDEDELATGDRSVLTVGQLHQATDATTHWEPLTPEVAQHEADPVVVIDVRWKVLRPQLPVSLADAAYCVHTRRVTRPSQQLRLAGGDAADRVIADLQRQSAVACSAWAAAAGIDLGHPVVHCESDGLCWRLIDAARDLHFIVRAVSPAEMANSTDTAPAAAAGGCETPALELLGYGEPDNECAVIIANRMPRPGARSMVHLVSLEQRFSLDGTACQLKDSQAWDDESRVRLVSLASWDFYCVNSTHTFTGLLQNLNGPGRGASPQFALPAGTTDNAAVNARLAGGSVALRHFMRGGERSVSWYHGPMMARPLAANISALLPAAASDSLILFDAQTGMFDISYAAAWQLGRMLTLANTALALALYRWKRAHVHAVRAARHVVDLGFHLPTRHNRPADVAAQRRVALPAVVQGWFDELSVLRHIPFSHLLPDEAMLPPESLRFFTVDAQWMACLRDGAFSVGRVLQRDSARDADHLQGLPAAASMTGLLLRSELVAGYPGLIVQAHGCSRPLQPAELAASRLDGNLAPVLQCLRSERLSPNVLLMVFSGDVRIVDMHLAPEALHFGLDQIDPDLLDVKLQSQAARGLANRDVGWLAKHLRRDEGQAVTHAVQPAAFPAEHLGLDDAQVPFRGPREQRTVDLLGLAAAIAKSLGTAMPAAHAPAAVSAPGMTAINPAAFALEMVAGLDLVRFVRQTREDLGEPDR